MHFWYATVQSYVQFFAFLLVIQFIPNIRFCRIFVRIFVFTEYSVFPNIRSNIRLIPIINLKINSLEKEPTLPNIRPNIRF
jgi:hypothetical protein